MFSTPKSSFLSFKPINARSLGTANFEHPLALTTGSWHQSVHKNPACQLKAIIFFKQDNLLNSLSLKSIKNNCKNTFFVLALPKFWGYRCYRNRHSGNSPKHLLSFPENLKVSSGLLASDSHGWEWISSLWTESLLLPGHLHSTVLSAKQLILFIISQCYYHSAGRPASSTGSVLGRKVYCIDFKAIAELIKATWS